MCQHKKKGNSNNNGIALFQLKEVMSYKKLPQIANAIRLIDSREKSVT